MGRRPGTRRVGVGVERSALRPYLGLLATALAWMAIFAGVGLVTAASDAEGADRRSLAAGAVFRYMRVHLDSTSLYRCAAQPQRLRDSRATNVVASHHTYALAFFIFSSRRKERCWCPSPLPKQKIDASFPRPHLASVRASRRGRAEQSYPSQYSIPETPIRRRPTLCQSLSDDVVGVGASRAAAFLPFLTVYPLPSPALTSSGPLPSPPKTKKNVFSVFHCIIISTTTATP